MEEERWEGWGGVVKEVMKKREKRKKHGITAISKLLPTEADLITIAL